jgi:hypothetical protein
MVSEEPEFYYGARAIGEAIGRSERAVFHMLEKENLPGAKRLGGKWCLHLPTYRAAFAEPPAAPKRALVAAA